MTSNMIKHLHCFYVELLIKAANYFVWPFAMNIPLDCSWDQKASSETEIKRVHLQLVESASFMIYKLLISNQSLILLLVHLRLHTLLITLRLDIKMGIVSYFLFIGYNINLYTCMNACAHTFLISEKVMLDYVITGINQCIKLIQVHKINTSSTIYFWKVFFNRRESQLSVNLQLIIPRFRCFWMNNKVGRDALLRQREKSAFFHPENIRMFQFVLKANIKICKKVYLGGYPESCIQ